MCNIKSNNLNKCYIKKLVVKMNVIIFYVGNVYKDYLIFFIEMIMKVLCSIYVVVLFISCVMC